MTKLIYIYKPAMIADTYTSHSAKVPFSAEVNYSELVLYLYVSEYETLMTKTCVLKKNLCIQ